jgi:hypothetical protein
MLSYILKDFNFIGEGSLDPYLSAITETMLSKVRARKWGNSMNNWPMVNCWWHHIEKTLISKVLFININKHTPTINHVKNKRFIKTEIFQHQQKNEVIIANFFTRAIYPNNSQTHRQPYAALGSRRTKHRKSSYSCWKRLSIGLENKS